MTVSVIDKIETQLTSVQGLGVQLYCCCMCSSFSGVNCSARLLCSLSSTVCSTSVPKSDALLSSASSHFSSPLSSLCSSGSPSCDSFIVPLCRVRSEVATVSSRPYTLWCKGMRSVCGSCMSSSTAVYQCIIVQSEQRQCVLIAAAVVSIHQLSSKKPAALYEHLHA
jgi:hypothetical protein